MQSMSWRTTYHIHIPLLCCYVAKHVACHFLTFFFFLTCTLLLKLPRICRLSSLSLCQVSRGFEIHVPVAAGEASVSNNCVKFLTSSILFILYLQTSRPCCRWHRREDSKTNSYLLTIPWIVSKFRTIHMYLQSLVIHVLTVIKVGWERATVYLALLLELYFNAKIFLCFVKKRVIFILSD